ncbi:amidase [Flaviflagellibacter deserti]|uniref:Amidase n=1 Tax=Flaviflagellibacter deserti TaxID=2267266 RepID=A0ABV9Z1S8_9HYPH
MPRSKVSAVRPPDDPFGAFCQDNHVVHAGADDGPLRGLTFAAKDVFDIKGSRTGFGHPAWLDSHPPATETATAVTRLLDAGATLAGRAISDELCYSLSGDNFHYGTPTNPRAPGRLPGGSSSGSAVAVAGGLVDFAIGTDCGGSVRVPASYCGLFGMRPTHGRIPLHGVSRFAPRFDTVGWFARDANTLQTVGQILLGAGGRVAPFRRLLIAEDAFERADPDVRQALEPGIAALRSQFPVHAGAVLSADGLGKWLETFLIVQAGEIWASLGGWVRSQRPVFGEGVRERFDLASQIEADELKVARDRAADIASSLAETIGEGDLIALPTTPCPAPWRDMALEDIQVEYRQKAMALLCSSGLGGLPQLTIPVGTVDGAPVGLSIMGRRGADSALLQLAVDVFGDISADRPPRA